MIPQMMRRTGWLLLLVSLVSVWWLRAQEGSSELDLERLQRATVFVMQTGGENLTTFCVGSGTIIRYDGLILTNAHNTVTSDDCPGDELIIAMTLDINEPPVPKYRAEIVQVDEGLDLALLRITRELDGRAINPDALPLLPFVELADSADVELDQTITFVGYPSLGNDSVRSITGTVTGFIAERSGGDQSWIKTSSLERVPGLMSGGGAYNQQGQLIGIPTTAPLSRQRPSEQCRLLDDTNGDGFINNNDFCVPVGDFITVLRPASFARPLLRSASLGLQVETITVPRFQETPAEEPTVSRLFFAGSVNNGVPNRVIGAAPAGTTSLYFFFDYANFTPTTIYEVRVSVNGVPNETFSLPPVRWSGGTNGLWYVGSSGQPWPNGTYEFRIFINGSAAGSRLITVGGAAQNTPEFSNLAFGLLDERGNLQGESYVLPSGDIAFARFVYRNMTPGLAWTSIWYYNGVQISRSDDIWSAGDGDSGARADVSIRPSGGGRLRPGNYRVELYLQEGDQLRLQATGDFVVAGELAGVLPEVFRNVEFFRADSLNAPLSEQPSTSFPDGAHTLYARFDWQNIVAGTLWTMQWLVDGTVFYEETVPWNTSDSGEDFTVRLTAPGGLPDGSYTLNLSINGILLETADVSVGIGQLPIDRFEQVGGTRLRGRIIDGDTRAGIPGATFVLISEDFSIEDFTWNQEQIYALAITDSNGNFEIDRSLVLDSPYSVYILADGYLPITQDGFAISAERLEEVGGSPIEMLVPLTRD